MQSVRVMRISGMCEMLWLVAVTPIDRFVMLQQRSREAGIKILTLSRVCREDSVSREMENVFSRRLLPLFTSHKAQ
jgi:hypothetical protein